MENNFSNKLRIYEFMLLLIKQSINRKEKLFLTTESQLTDVEEILKLEKLSHDNHCKGHMPTTVCLFPGCNH